MKATKRALISSAIALLICISMLLGTTYAWFTDEVSSKGNIIQTGTLDVTMEWADGAEDPANATWTDASKGSIYGYMNWEPGYADAKHFKISNVGTLALNYQMRIVPDGIVSELADVIDVFYVAEDKAVDRTDIENATYLGTLAEVINTEKHLSKTVFGALKAGDPSDIHTLILKMKETAGNEYQNMDLGCTFRVELIAFQMASEADSFDNLYDESAPNPAVPAAFVRPLDDLSVNVGIHSDYGDLEGKLTLDTGYTFQPTMGRPEDVSFEDLLNGTHLPYDPSYSVETSAYRYWHADFVVKADRDVPASSMALAGYYALFCDLANDGNWIALSHDDIIPAGTEIRLVEAMADGAITVSWNDLCAYGNDGLGFMCGAVDLTGENSGTILTVELRLYAVPEQGECAEGGGCTHPYSECELGGDNYITVGKFEYTFPTAVKSPELLQEALNQGGEIKLTHDITLDDGVALTVPAGVEAVLNLNGKTITAKSTVAGATCAIKNEGTLTIKNGTVTFEGVGDPNFGYGTNTINNTGKLTIDGASIINTTAIGSSVAIDCAAGAELVVNSGLVKSEKNAIRLCPFGSAAISATINGGEITGARAIQIQLPSSDASSAPKITLTVNGGTLTGNGPDELAIYSFSAGQNVKNVTATFNGGVYNGHVRFGGGSKNGMEVVHVNGGTFNGDLGRYLANDGWMDLLSTVEVGTLSELQNALNNATANATTLIVFTADITGDVLATQKSTADVIIDGNGKTFTGVMTVFGNGNQKGTEALTIKNVNFVAKAGADSCIVSPDRSTYNKYSYAHNLTVDNCTFTDKDGVVNCAAIRTEDGGDVNWTVKNCVVDSTMHSLLQVQNVEGTGLTVDNCKVSSKNGVNLNSTVKFVMTNCEFNVKGYAVRFGVNSGSNPNVAKDYTINDCTLTSAGNDGDAVIIFRASAAIGTLDLSGTTLNGPVQVSGSTNIVISGN